jgi:hypothetical protein
MYSTTWPYLLPFQIPKITIRLGCVITICPTTSETTSVSRARHRSLFQEKSGILKIRNIPWRNLYVDNESVISFLRTPNLKLWIIQNFKNPKSVRFYRFCTAKNLYNVFRVYSLHVDRHVVIYVRFLPLIGRFLDVEKKTSYIWVARATKISVLLSRLSLVFLPRLFDLAAAFKLRLLHRSLPPPPASLASVARGGEPDLWVKISIKVVFSKD